MYRRRLQGWMKHIDFMVIELLCFQMAFCLAGMMRHGLVNPYSSLLYRNTAIVAAIFQVFIIISFNVFHDVLRRGYYMEFLNSIKTVFVVMMLVSFYLFAIQQGGTFSRIVLVTCAGYYWALAYLFRNIWKYVLHIRMRGREGRKSLVLITHRERVENLITVIQEKNYGEFKISGIVLLDENVAEKDICDIPVVANRDSAMEYICRDWVDEVFFDVPEEDSLRRELLTVLVEMSMVIHIHVGNADDFASQKREIQKIGNYTVITMSANIRNFREMAIKRLLDIAGGLVGCVITGILFIFLAPAIYIKSPGPIFFSQMRVGRNGKLFKIYKFRSMYMDAEERKKELQELNEVEDGMMFKIENDPRIIGSEKGPGKGLGNFIRKTSLDEFPQFLNILKGDMSLVGTRPPTVDEWEKYNFHHRGRLSIKPGLTGMWQISGRSDIQDFEEVVALDRKYITEWTLGLDIKILLKTVLVVLRREGSR